LGFCLGSRFWVFSDVLFSQYVNTNNSDLKIPVFTVLPGNGAKIWLRFRSVVIFLQNAFKMCDFSVLQIRFLLS
jgi:hypothetical protein